MLRLVGSVILMMFQWFLRPLLLAVYTNKFFTNRMFILLLIMMMFWWMKIAGQCGSLRVIFGKIGRYSYFAFCLWILSFCFLFLNFVIMFHYFSSHCSAKGANKIDWVWWWQSILFFSSNNAPQLAKFYLNSYYLCFIGLSPSASKCKYGLTNLLRWF